MPQNKPVTYDRTCHGAAWTDDYVFQQLIPYIGNKRKLLDLIGRAIDASSVPEGATFLDLFAGSGVVSRYAKHRGFRVIANDWEPYAEAINRCYIACDAAPNYGPRSYESMIADLNALPPVAGWVSTHLCPSDDGAIDPTRDRLFYMRKNGMRIDAIRNWIAEAETTSGLSPVQRACLLAPLLYAACYTSNTSGVFKGFHNGWGGQTGTALYRIKSELSLKPAVFHANGCPGEVYRSDATELALQLGNEEVHFAYLDPPYNQHPYGSNYHVLNTIALWDSPPLAPKITGRGDKAAIRRDWRDLRRSRYNHRNDAAAEYERLLGAIKARFIATSYSTDGTIPIELLVRANIARGNVAIFTKDYKRYRVSRQRFSARPKTVEFILLTDTRSRSKVSVDEIVAAIAGETVRLPTGQAF